MERRPFGRTGMELSVLGFGGSEIGFREVPPDEVSELLNGALDAGLNVIDTAECYLASEELIGNAVSHRRDDYRLFTKCGHPFVMGEDDWSPESLLMSIERSLRRLRTDHLDLIQLHSCEEEVLRQGDAIAALERAREKGHTRFIGYSGDGAAAKYAVECGRFDALQTSVSIADQEAIELTLPLAIERGLGVVVKRPIANAAWIHPGLPASTYLHPYWRRLRELRYDFLQEDPLSPEAFSTALRFTLSAPGVHTAIVGTTRPGRYAENAAHVAAGPLPPDQYERIRARWREVAAPTWTGET
jgi:aryl-alcohol dehydrogenase-like predicted oxidoreductase